MSGVGAASSARRPGPSERRAAAIDAFIDLVLERGDHPRPEEVAERAGVSMASFYRYFESLDELRQGAFARLMDRFPELFLIPAIGTGGRSDRIEAFADVRLALHERLHPLPLLARGAAQAKPGVSTQIDVIRQASADQISLHFADELTNVADDLRASVVASVNVLTSVESWQQFRCSHGFTLGQTRQAWVRAIDQLLPTVPSTEEPSP